MTAPRFTRAATKACRGSAPTQRGVSYPLSLFYRYGCCGAETPYISQRVEAPSRDDSFAQLCFFDLFSFSFSVDLLECPLHIKTSPRGLGSRFEVSLEVSTYHSPTLPHPSYLSLSCSISYRNWLEESIHHLPNLPLLIALIIPQVRCHHCSLIAPRDSEHATASAEIPARNPQELRILQCHVKRNHRALPELRAIRPHKGYRSTARAR